MEFLRETLWTLNFSKVTLHLLCFAGTRRSRSTRLHCGRPGSTTRSTCAKWPVTQTHRCTELHYSRASVEVVFGPARGARHCRDSVRRADSESGVVCDNRRDSRGPPSSSAALALFTRSVNILNATLNASYVPVCVVFKTVPLNVTLKFFVLCSLSRGWEHTYRGRASLSSTRPSLPQLLRVLVPKGGVYSGTLIALLTPKWV